jgi:hypothetical protein
MNNTLTAVKAFRLLALATMRPFTKDDWHAFAGCESREPLIGEVEDTVLILDDQTLLVLTNDDMINCTGGTLFALHTA